MTYYQQPDPHQQPAQYGYPQQPPQQQLVVVQATGHNGQARFDGTFVTITRRGLGGRLTVGKGEKRIPLASINAVQWKPAGWAVNGFIQFEIAGVGGTRSRAGRQTHQAVSDENSVVFWTKQQPAFQRLRAAVEQAIAARHAGGGQPVMVAPSAADEIAKLAALMQQGMLSRQEFEQAKAHLLRR